MNILGSISFTKLVEAAKAGHPAFSRAESGEVFFNVDISSKKEADKYGKDISICLGGGNLKKGASDEQKSEMKEKCKAFNNKLVGKDKYFIGNAKTFDFSKSDEAKQQQPTNFTKTTDDDLPF
jgi:hypothetical protein